MSSKGYKAIFVSNIAAYTKLEDLTHYFSNFGRVHELQTTRMSRKNKMVFKLIASSSTCSRILNYSPHQLGDRVIQCKPFLEGKDLVRLNVDINSRRVILKGIPSLTTEQELKNYLESSFGQVETMFEFKTDSKLGIARGRVFQKSFLSFSVLFRESRAARQCTAEGISSSIFGSNVFAEKYKHVKQRGSNTSSKQLLSPTLKVKSNIKRENVFQIMKSSPDFNVNKLEELQKSGDLVQRKALIHCQIFRKLDHSPTNVRINLLKSC